VQSVARKATVLTVATSAGTTTYGGNVTFTATLVPAVAGVPVTGSVQFFDGATPIGAPQPLSNSRASLTIATLTGGGRSIRAEYRPGSDPNYSDVAGTAPTIVVNRATSTPVVVDIPNPSTYGATVTFTATLAASGGGVRPTGTVQFFAAGVPLGSPQTLVSGTASVTSAMLPAGSQSITAEYRPGSDPNYVGQTSLAITQTVSKATSTPGVAGTPNPTTFGDGVTFTATILAAGAGVVPTGTIQFRDNGVNIGTPVALVGGRATFTTSALSATDHAITAVYSGDASYLAATSPVFTQTVNRIASATTLTTPAGTTVHGTAVTFTATVPSVGAGGVVSGIVTFFDDTVPGARVALAAVNILSGTATFTTTSLPAGTRTIVAVYDGNSNYAGSTSGSVSRTVTQATSTPTLTNVPATSNYGSAVTLTASVPTVTGGRTPTGSVTFMDGTTTLGTVALDAAGNAVLTVSTLAAGAHTLSASYSGDANYVARTSLTMPQTVNKVLGATTVAGLPNPSTYGDSVTITATVARVGAGAAATGSVTFKDGTTVLGTATLSAAGTATLTTAALAAGARSFTVAYAGDANYLASTSTAVPQTVNKATRTPTLTVSAATTTYGDSITYTTTVPAVGGSGTVAPTGTVQFLDGALVLGTGTITLVNGVATATLTTRAVAGGVNKSITARYSGDTNYALTTSAVIAQTVNRASSVPAVTSSVASTVSGGAVTFTATLAAATGGAVPRGTVQFQDRGANIGVPVTLSTTGVATLPITTLAIGSRSITAVFTPSAVETNYVATTSLALAYQVTPPITATTASTVSLTSSAPSAAAGTNVTFTATITAPAGSNPSGGVVEFWNGTTYLGAGTITLVNGVYRATFSTSTLARGMQSIRARFVGTSTFAASDSGLLSQTIS